MKKKCRVLGVTCYPNKLEASLAIARIVEKNKKCRHRSYREEPIRAYECNHCHKWHLTSQQPDPGRSRHENVDAHHS